VRRFIAALVFALFWSAAIPSPLWFFGLSFPFGQQQSKNQSGEGIAALQTKAKTKAAMNRRTPKQDTTR